VVNLAAYRGLVRDSRARRLLAGLAVSSLGDGTSTVYVVLRRPGPLAGPAKLYPEGACPSNRELTET
jgi:hypothetical protein